MTIKPPQRCGATLTETTDKSIRFSISARNTLQHHWVALMPRSVYSAVSGADTVD